MLWKLRVTHLFIPESSKILAISSTFKLLFLAYAARNCCGNRKKALVLVGDGSLRGQMQDFIDAHGLKSVYFMGFQNRNDVNDFSAPADIVALPDHRETCGLVVNEALSFSLPVVVSDQVGASVDLVIPDEIGYISPAGEIPALADQISKLLGLPGQDREKMKEKSYSLIKDWSNRDLAVPLGGFLDSIYQAQS